MAIRTFYILPSHIYNLIALYFFLGLLNSPIPAIRTLGHFDLACLQTAASIDGVVCWLMRSSRTAIHFECLTTSPLVLLLICWPVCGVYVPIATVLVDSGGSLSLARLAVCIWVMDGVDVVVVGRAGGRRLHIGGIPG